MRSPGEREALGLLGLARRAGAVVSGMEATRTALKTGEVKLILVAEDASFSQVGRVIELATARRVPMVRVSEKDALGKFLGQSPRSLVGVTGHSFAAELSRLLPSVEHESGEDRRPWQAQEEPS